MSDKRTATTLFEGEYFLHSFLWNATRHQLKQASALSTGHKFDDLAAMVLAFNTLEAYLNFVGVRLAPEIWKDERNYFQREPYRGFSGKIKKVYELCGLIEPNKDERPYASIWEAKEFRDIIAHARTEIELSRVEHVAGQERPKWVPAIESRVTHDKANQFAEDISSVIESLHVAVRQKLPDDHWLGEQALTGLIGYSHGTTRLNT